MGKCEGKGNSELTGKGTVNDKSKGRARVKARGKGIGVGRETEG